jgi:hypothetical protein
MDLHAWIRNRQASTIPVGERLTGAVQIETSVLRAIGDGPSISVDDLRAAATVDALRTSACLAMLSDDGHGGVTCSDGAAFPDMSAAQV